jgi:hypothetical protein
MLLPKSADALLAIARPLFDKEGPQLTLAAFRLQTGVPRSRIVRFFGGWLGLKAALGLEPISAPSRRVSPGRTREAILAQFRKVASEVGEGLTLFDFVRRTGISTSCIYLRFGTWRELRRQGGLRFNGTPPCDYTDEQILVDVLRVAQLTREYVTCASYEAHGSVSIKTLIRRFGTFDMAMTAYCEYMDEMHLRFPDEKDRLAYQSWVLAELDSVRKRHRPPPIHQLPPAIRMHGDGKTALPPIQPRKFP